MPLEPGSRRGRDVALRIKHLGKEELYHVVRSMEANRTELICEAIMGQKAGHYSFALHFTTLGNCPDSRCWRASLFMYLALLPSLQRKVVIKIPPRLIEPSREAEEKYMGQQRPGPIVSFIESVRDSLCQPYGRLMCTAAQISWRIFFYFRYENPEVGQNLCHHPCSTLYFFADHYMGCAMSRVLPKSLCIFEEFNPFLLISDQIPNSISS